MDQNSASWNRVVLWMRQLETLNQVTSRISFKAQRE
jgi:hypothetical protein